MKGIVFNLLEALTVRGAGEDAWDHALEQVGVSGAYTAIGNYRDEEFTALLAAVPVPPGADAVRLRWFGRQAMPMLRDRYPLFFTPYTATWPFLLTLNDVVHAEVRKLYPGATVPVFDFTADPADPDVLLLDYRSPRRLCALAEGFVLGAADHFADQVDVRQDVCMHRGDDHCELRCDFGAAAAPLPSETTVA